jgi:hypothetical protein
MSGPKGTGTFWENGKLVEREDDDEPWFNDMVRDHARMLDAVNTRKRRRRRLAEMTPRKKTGQDVGLRIRTLLRDLKKLDEKEPDLVTRALKTKQALARLMHHRLGYASEAAAEKFLRRRLPGLWRKKNRTSSRLG